MFKTSQNKFIFLTSITIAAIIVVAVFTKHLDAGPKDPSEKAAAESARSEADAMIGTYDTQIAFQKYPLQETLMEKVTSLRVSIQEAEDEGNYEKVQQLRQKYEEERIRILEKFQKDIRDALPEVAEDTGVKVIAVEFAYIDEDVKTVDITPHLVEAFANEDKP